MEIAQDNNILQNVVFAAAILIYLTLIEETILSLFLLNSHKRFDHSK